MKHLLGFVLWLMLCAAGAACADAPGGIRATYDIYKAGIRIGQIEEVYRREKDRYTLISTTGATGLFSLFRPGKIIVRSSGLIDDHGLKPQISSAEHEGEAQDNRSAELDWNAKKLTLIHQAQRTVVALPEGTQDRLSAMYQFMFLPLQSPMLSFQMINGGYLLNFDFAISPGPLLKTPAGEFATMYLDNRAQGAKERTELWLATQYHNLPCKMIVTDAGGGKITQILRKLDISP
ncbi:MAG: DUF3108 domain-containing protein [Nitrosomonadales bacterium]|nr:DUF3108 domain-containing protein [Nitrosomonadales bacterium]